MTPEQRRPSDSRHLRRYAFLPVGRRRFLAGAAALAATAAVAGCGPSGSDGGRVTPSPEAQGLVNAPRDSTAAAKSGGTLRSVAAADVPTLDPHSAQNLLVHTQIAAYTYPRLLRFVSAKYPDKPKGDLEGDLAESIELSADRLQVTFKLRQGLKWDPRPPLNGRAVDAQDVTASWNRFVRLSPYRGDLAFDANLAPGATIDSVNAPDARTVVVKLKQPDASIPALLASDRHFFVLPREADAGFDPRFDARGYGPYRLSDYRPGALRVWSRNPDYYVKGRPFIETIELPMIGDYPSRLAQFKAGNVWTHVASQGDALSVKKEISALLLQKGDSFSITPSSLAFGYEGDSPWKDDRLRQAVSMLIDRETIIDLLSNRGRFEAEGIDFEVRYHTAVAAGWEGYWTDPRYEGVFGPNARYFRYDPDEAQKLISAAGYPDGLESTFHYNGGNQYGGLYARTVELVSGMLAEGGIRLRLEPHPYASDWLPNYHYAYTGAQNPGKTIKGFNGLVYRVATQAPSPLTQLFAQFHKDGVRFEGMSPDGKNANLGDPEVNNAVAALRREFDTQRQQAMAQDIARMMAKKAYVIPNLPYTALGLTLTWPVLANFGLYRTWPAGSAPTETNVHHWIDVSKPPLTAA